MHALKASASPRPIGPCARPAVTPRAAAAAASAAPRGRALPAAAAAAADDSSSEAKPAPAAAAAAAATALLLAATATLAPAPPPALAAPGEKLGEFAASGLLFKDSVEVSALADRDLPGAVVYISDFKRSLTDKLSKDFFNEPSQASLTCAFVGENGGGGGGAPSSLASEPTAALAKRLGGAGGGGVEVFAERKGLNVFRDKTLRVRRLFDADRRAAVYVAYSTRLGTAGDEGGVSTGRYRTSVCVVPLPAYAAPAPAAAEAAAAAAE